MDKNSKIYIAGHTGLVGSAILRNLQAKGFKNFVMKTSKELDLTDQKATEAFFAEHKPEFVFLAAAKVGGIHANNVYRADFIHQNLLIQSNVVGSSHKHGVKKLLFLGSSCIYPKNAPQPLTEDSLLTSELEYTNEPYAIAKIAGIKLTESFNLQYGTNYISVMPTNLYGVNDNFDLDKAHVMPALIRKVYLAKLLEEGNFEAIARNLKLPIATSEKELSKLLAEKGITRNGHGVVLKVWGTGKPKREFLHVDDMARACVYVMEKINFGDLVAGMTEVRNAHINIGTGSDISIKELALLIKKIIGFRGEVEFDSTKPDGTMRKLLNVKKLNDMGWRHEVELEDGLRRTIDWYLEGAKS